VNFLLVLIELFSLGVKADALQRILVQNRQFRSNGDRLPKILGRKGRPHQPFFSETWAKWSFVWDKNLDRCFDRFVTMHTFDRQTDRQTEFSSLDRVCIACSAVKKLRPSGATRLRTILNCQPKKV